MTERHAPPRVPLGPFLKRLGKSLLVIFGILGASLLLGMAGYHALEHLSWVDSFLNASMILSGMGPACELRTESGKIFAGCYALFSGIVFLTSAAVLLAPVGNHLLRTFHMNLEQSRSINAQQSEKKHP